MNAKILSLVIAGAGCMAALPAYASLTTDGGAHTQHFSVDAAGNTTWESEWRHNNAGNFSHKARHFGTGDIQRADNHGWKDPHPTPAMAPEIDPASAAAALTLLAGGLAFVRGRRRKD